MFMASYGLHFFRRVIIARCQFENVKSFTPNAMSGTHEPIMQPKIVERLNTK